jgi:ADP-ribose pyrophosphatase YjhB (NUDIX family)
MSIFNHNIYDNVRTRAIILHQGCLLLLSPIKPGDQWCPPGGGLQPNESLSECVIREVYEESGVEVAVAGLAFLREWIVPQHCPYPDPQAQAGQVGFGLEIFFYVTPLNSQPQPRLETPTSQIPQWIPLAEVPHLDPLWPKELKALVRRLAEGETVGGIFSFIIENLEIYRGEPDRVSFDFQIDKNGCKVSY